MEETIPNLIIENINNLLVRISSQVETHCFQSKQGWISGSWWIWGGLLSNLLGNCENWCKIRVRQGDPLSPLLFCISEDVLSRGIENLVEQGKLDFIRGSRSIQVPSRLLYPDDIMNFFKGKVSSINAPMSLINSYAQISGQLINPGKSTIYSGYISPSRLDHISNMIGFAD